MTQEEYILLYEKLLSGTCTDYEKQLLTNYADGFELNNDPWKEEMGNEEQIKTEIYNRLHLQMESKKKSTLRWIVRLSAVAAISVLVMLSALYLFNSPPPDSASQKHAEQLGEIVKPGGSKAVLTLADGSSILLDSINKGIITNQNGVEIKQIELGQISYGNIQQAGGSLPSSINTISTPMGGQYQVRLGDGTQVWLNAASSLRFPTSFTGKERVVEITGEAYFEVAKNAEKPFQVNFNGNSVTVLGTHFNVMAYPEEADNKITLLEGSVRVSNSTSQSLLKPGTQALVSDSNSVIKTRNANTEEAVAWKNGYFIFENENIQSIMRKLTRWYDLEVVYQGDMSGKEYSGAISRFENVSEVLDMLESTESIHFNLKGRRISIMP